MPTFENLESLASVRAKINDGIQNAETALDRLDAVEPTVVDHGVRITALEGGGGGGATNLAWNATTSTVTSDTGTDATLTVVDGTNPGLMSVADKTKLNAITGTNTGDQTSIVGITGTKAQFDTAVTDGNFMYVGDAPTAHTHTLANITDVTMTVANLNTLDDGVNTALHFHDADRNRANHTGTQLSSTISDFNEAAQDAVGAMVDASLTYVDATPTLQRAALTGAVTASAGSNTTALGSFTLAQLNAAVSDADVANATHTHTLANVTDVTMTVANLNSLDDGVNTTLHFHDSDRSRANHTGTQTASTISDFSEAVDDRVAALVVAGTNMTVTYNDVANTLTFDAAGGGAGTNLTYTAATRVIASDTGTDATLPLVTSGDAGLAPASGGGTTNFLRADGTWAAPGGGGTPGGSSGEIQYNNAGAFGGAVDAEIEGGQLRFPSITTPTAPAVDGIKLYTKSQVGQRDMLAILYPNGREARLDEDESEFLQLQYRPAPGSNALLGDGSLPQTITGTATATTVQTTNFYLMYPRIEARATTAATNAVAGFRGGGGNPYARVGKDANAPGGFNFRCAWGPAAYSMPATYRACCGLLNTGAAPTDVEPSTQVNGIWMGWDAADTNIQMMHNDGTGTATKIDLGASFPVPTGTNNNTVYLLELYSPNETTQSVEYHVIKYNAASRSPAAEASGTITTNLPSVTTLLANRVWASAGGTSSQIGVALFGVSIDLDYN